MINRQDIIKWAGEVLEGTDRFVVDVLVKNNDVILVFLDADTELTIEHCVEVSRHIESKLDRDELDFELRVSSAGLDQPLKFPRQYRKNIGRTLKIQNVEGETIMGKILDMDEDSILLQTIIEKKLGKQLKKQLGDNISLPFGQIESAWVMVDFKG